MSGFHKGGFYVETVDLVQHGLDKPFDSVLGGAIGSKTWDAESTGCGREDEVAARILGAEVREGELNDVQCAKEIRIELIAKIVLVLVFTWANYAWELQYTQWWMRGRERDIP